jgi:hypothetical protein
LGLEPKLELMLMLMLMLALVLVPTLGAGPTQLLSLLHLLHHQ